MAESGPPKNKRRRNPPKKPEPPFPPLGRATVAPALQDPNRRAEWDLPTNESTPGPYMVELNLLYKGGVEVAASIVARQDAANEEDITFRWGAMGHDGAQAVNAKSTSLGKPGTSYPFEVGKWLNLDGNQVIVKGNPPSGAHSDIIHPHTAWAALAAAGIV